jgi:hypothetical protein
MSLPDQAREVAAMLNLNGAELADVLRAPSTMLCDWFDGDGHNTEHVQRLMQLTRLLVNAGVSAADSISPRFVRKSLNEGEPSLIELLKADTIDETLVASLLAEAKRLEDEAKRTRVAREDRLRALGFEEPTPTQRKENLALNIALCPWPKE